VGHRVCRYGSFEVPGIVVGCSAGYGKTDQATHGGGRVNVAHFVFQPCHEIVGLAWARGEVMARYARKVPQFSGELMATRRPILVDEGPGHQIAHGFTVELDRERAISDSKKTLLKAQDDYASRTGLWRTERWKGCQAGTA
jgi:hypothetical protein